MTGNVWKITDRLGVTSLLVYLRELCRAQILLGKLQRRISGLSAANSSPAGGECQRKRQRVVVNATRPLRGLPFHFESLVARGLAFDERTDIYVIWDDGVLEHWDTVTCNDTRAQRYLRSFGRRYAPRLLSLFGLNQSPYSSLVPLDTIRRVRREFGSVALTVEEVRDVPAIIYKGVNIGEHAFTSTIRYYQRGYIPELEEVPAYFRKSVINGALSVEVAQGLLDRGVRPDRVITSHGLYSTWGPYFDVLRKANVEVLVYGMASAQQGMVTLLRNTFLQVMGREDTPPPPSVGSELGEDEKDAIRRFLDQRFAHQVGDVVQYRQLRVRRRYSESRMPPRDGRPIFALFSNVLWDAVVAGREGVFANPIEWILETVSHFLLRSDLQLVIKAHPSERALMSGAEGLLDVLQSAKPEVWHAENITVLPSDTHIDAYDLIEYADAVVVLTGTVGLEAACMGKAVVACGRPHYAHCVYTVSDLHEYVTAFDRLDKLRECAQSNRETALRHAYWYFIEAPLRIPFADEERWGEMELDRIQSVDDLHPDFNPDIRAIVDFVLAG